MGLIALWIITASDKQVIYRRYFATNAIKSRNPLFLVPLNSSEEEKFKNSILKNLSLIDDGEFDFTGLNQLPVLNANYKGVDIWPIVVIEANRILFCGLPLVNSDSRNVTDHISISRAIDLLQIFSDRFVKDNRLHYLEEFISQYFPFGLMIKYPIVMDRSSQTVQKKQAITLRVNETISSAVNGLELIYGSLIIESSFPTQFSLVLDRCAFDLILPPNCWIQDDILNIMSPPKISNIKYKVKSEPVIEYSYLITRTTILDVELSIDLAMSNFNKFIVIFPSVRVIKKCVLSTGKMHIENGLVWNVGKIKKMGGQKTIKLLAKFEASIESKMDAEVRFNTDETVFSQYLKEVVKDNKLIKPITGYNLKSGEYRLIPTFK